MCWVVSSVAFFRIRAFLTQQCDLRGQQGDNSIAEGGGRDSKKYTENIVHEGHREVFIIARDSSMHDFRTNQYTRNEGRVR